MNKETFYTILTLCSCKPAGVIVEDGTTDYEASIGKDISVINLHYPNLLRRTRIEYIVGKEDSQKVQKVVFTVQV